jgi:alkanesulfonate monooxygenase SsuD/methylene tetrahydromethanopterin reductase-like flavin-dependent oxidoreductase (luciferase family)
MNRSPTLHFGMKTTQYGLYEDILRVWQEADELPEIEHAWLFDHPMPIGRADPSGPCLDGWTLLAALAAQTRRLRLGLLVASNVNQTPQWLAKRGATLDVISHGRLEFGLGAGGGEREHSAYGTDFFSAGERVRRLEEACQIILGMWRERAFNFSGSYYHLSDAYCEPKPVQQPHPPLLIGGWGEQLTLRVVARYADIWNGPGFPHTTAEEYRRRSRILDGYCAEIGRDPATIMRSTQILLDPKESPERLRQVVHDYIAAGATHLVLAPLSGEAGIARWLSSEIIEPVRQAAMERA